MKPRNTWEMDSIQFPRLISEIYAMGLTTDQLKTLCLEMDLELEDLTKLFDRADKRWQAIKANTRKVRY